MSAISVDEISKALKHLDNQMKSLKKIDSNKFKMEMECYWMSDNYDKPIYIKEDGSAKIHLYEAIGIGEKDVKIEEEFINKSKEFYININGKYQEGLTGWENDINIHLKMDTGIYDSYSVFFNNGIIGIVLIEIANEKPNVKRVQ